NWKQHQIDLTKEQIYVNPSSHDEARSAVQLCIQNKAKLVAVDPKIHSLLASEILTRGHKPYLPEGERLIDCEASKMAIGWEDFRK